MNRFTNPLKITKAPSPFQSPTSKKNRNIKQRIHLLTNSIKMLINPSQLKKKQPIMKTNSKMTNMLRMISRMSLNLLLKIL